MGCSSSSKINKCALAIDNSIIYLPSQQIKGNICIEVTKLQPNSRVVLNLKGIEEIKFEEKIKRGKSTSKKTYHKFNEFYNHQYIVYNFNYMINTPICNQFTFPISFFTPEGYPSSFEFSEGSNQASIRYKLTASIESMSSEEQCSSQIFIYYCNNKLTTINSLQQQTTQEIKTFCCENKGINQITTNILKNYYSFGENIAVNILCNNSKCNDNIKRIALSAYQKISLQCGEKKKIISNKVNNIELGSVQKNQTKSFDTFINIPDCSLQEHHENQGLTWKNLFPSLQSSLIKCEYSLNIDPYFESCCTNCCRNTPISLQILLFNRPPQISSFPIKYPSNWKPTEMKEVIIPIFYDIKSPNQTNQASSDMQQSSNEFKPFNEPIDIPHVLGNPPSKRTEVLSQPSNYFGLDSSLSHIKK